MIMTFMTDFVADITAYSVLRKGVCHTISLSAVTVTNSIKSIRQTNLIFSTGIDMCCVNLNVFKFKFKITKFKLRTTINKNYRLNNSM